MKNNIKGFIFDLDGVITDTSEYHFQSWKQLSEEEGFEFNREINEKLRGVSRMRSLEIILDGKKLSEAKKKELTDRKNKYYQQLLENLNKDNIIGNMENILKRLKERGFKIAVASSSKNAKKVLKRLKIIDIFDTISDGDSVENAKPAPDLFLHTAEKLALEPEECVVVEDAESGIKAALKANMLAVGIGPEERLNGADIIYTEISELNIDEILNFTDYN
ncbi:MULTISPECIES: beta-phosphoglucomutase [unclassified Halanaerobium]|uniref:beta-phosphoglucomutase n=1 Tax=unclassified Halanaerobium TaxID=2641197 RepID=UPI000DF1F60D|nr:MULTISPECIES: beta-phosphoglucomutase [unclassified Halanaerobium]RCW41169.1 beta-phosphoglucomutase [Halanaerobium sp. MA284_MarDTE_T2]RCW79605.1 beta-phosphoglucomutase [Halanaerobium sp. DL-01]